MMKRVCFFAGYDKKGRILPYVSYFLDSLCEFADIYYMADCAMKESELQKISPYVKNAWAYRHGKYDFGSWQELVFKLVPRNVLQEYDEFLFVNDSSFGPLFSLKPFFDTAEKDVKTRAWGLSAFENDYIGSYFFCVKKEVFFSPAFQNFIIGVKEEKEVGDVIRNYEKRLPEIFAQAGAEYKTFFNEHGKSIFNDWRYFIKKGFPLLKLQIFNRARLYSDRECLPGWRNFIKKNTEYPAELIDSYLKNIGLPASCFDSFGFKIKSLWWCIQRIRRKMFRIHFHKKEKILVVFGISCIDTTKEKSLRKIKTFGI